MKLSKFFRKEKKITMKSDKRERQKSYDVIQVAMMLAGLDGRVTPEEYVAFEDIFRFYGCSDSELGGIFDRCLESAGYIVLQSQRLPSEELIVIFIDRARKVLSDHLPKFDAVDKRSAFMLWTIMAMSDSDYSSIERQGVIALLQVFDEKRDSAEIMLEKCEQFAYKLLKLQKAYSDKPTLVNKRRCENILRHIQKFIKEG